MGNLNEEKIIRNLESLSSEDRDLIRRKFEETYLNVEAVIIEKDKAFTFLGIGKLLSYLEVLGEDYENNERFRTAVRLANLAFDIDILAQKDTQK